MGRHRGTLGGFGKSSVRKHPPAAVNTLKRSSDSAIILAVLLSPFAILVIGLILNKFLLKLIN